MVFCSNDRVVPTKTGIARLRPIFSRFRGHVAFWVGRAARNTRCSLNRALIPRYGQPPVLQLHSSETPPGGRGLKWRNLSEITLHGISLIR